MKWCSQTQNYVTWTWSLVCEFSIRNLSTFIKIAFVLICLVSSSFNFPHWLPIVRGLLGCLSVLVFLYRYRFFFLSVRLRINNWLVGTVAHGLTTSGHGRWISAGDSATGSRSVCRRRRGGCLLFEHGPIKRIIILMIQSAEKDAEQLPQVHVVRSLLKPKSSGKGDIICVKTMLIYFISGSETLPLVNGL